MSDGDLFGQGPAHLPVQKLAGDKGYGHARGRACLRRRGIVPDIPTRKDQRANPRFDKETYRQRNIIERCVGWLEANRQPATRHAKLAVIRRCSCLLRDPSNRT